MTYHVAHLLAHTLKTPSMASQMRGVRSMSGRPLEFLRTWEGERGRGREWKREREGGRERARERERERERDGETTRENIMRT